MNDMNDANDIKDIKNYPEFEDDRWPIWARAKRPFRYVGAEWGVSVPKPASSNLVRVCLAFPDVYEVGMSYLGFQIFYSLLRKLKNADVERVYAPWPDMEGLLRESAHRLGSIESDRPLKDFDILAITLQYELCYTNVITLLDLGGIPTFSKDRKDDQPIVIAGGPCAYVPGSMSSFIDAFAIGDGEVLWPQLVECMSAQKGKSRSEKLAALSVLPGVYVPLYPPKTPVKRQFLANLDDGYIHDTMIVPSFGIVHDRAPAQVFRGCTHGCRFCQAGMIERPVRERSAPSVCAQINELLKNTGWEEFGFLSLATCDWSGLQDAIDGLWGLLGSGRYRLSLPSLRADNFASFTVPLAAKLDKMKKGGITLAPEAATERLRNVINKNVTEQDLINSLHAVFGNGWDKVKLYFMMGLPTETQEDLDAIISITKEALSIAKSYKKRASIAISIAGFVPKAHTPFQWEAQDGLSVLSEKSRYIKHGIFGHKGSKSSKSLQVAYHDPNQTFLEGIFARGDEKLGALILEAWRLGARFDGWTETFDMSIWEKALLNCQIDAQVYTGKREIDAPLPWDIIDAGVTKAFLLNERGKAYANEVTEDCRKGSCTSCGVNR